MWLRFYVETLDDPKVQRLPAPLFKHWVNLLCLSKQHNGTLPPVSNIAFRLRLTEHAVENVLNKLIVAGLLDHNGAGLEPHNWGKRQYQSDISTDRVRRWRKRRNGDAGNDDETFHETPRNGNW